MNNATAILFGDLKSFISTMLSVQTEAEDLYKYYFAAAVNTDVDALATSGTAATSSSALTKGEVQAGATFLGELVDFFNNSAVSTGDYLATLDNCIDGNNVRSSTPAHTEAFGTRLNSLSGTLVQLFKNAKDILDLYSNSGISADFGSSPTTRVIYGTAMTKADMSSALTIVEQYKKMLNNEAVSTAEYGATVSAWRVHL